MTLNLSRAVTLSETLAGEGRSPVLAKTPRGRPPPLIRVTGRAGLQGGERGGRCTSRGGRRQAGSAPRAPWVVSTETPSSVGRLRVGSGGSRTAAAAAVAVCGCCPCSSSVRDIPRVELAVSTRVASQMGCRRGRRRPLIRAVASWGSGLSCPRVPRSERGTRGLLESVGSRLRPAPEDPTSSATSSARRRRRGDGKATTARRRQARRRQARRRGEARRGKARRSRRRRMRQDGGGVAAVEWRRR